ncbi:FtsX-like permease family protein [Flavobacterium sp. Sd200]|uniref:ABC transporter permease n=1 Tax=Flavobacterium sp. Sd200 TaxID=2692211 RepID=UPI001369D5FF|nr:ABC transporter permease [Flavobacterium sp. Sd200]MXN90281.1 FtsX-like permease family protein [Flavobacterium sp. Sd200]
MLKNWLKIFLHHLRVNAFFSALNVLGLSLGISGLIFAILYLNDEQSYNSWNPNKDNVFQSISVISEDMIWPHNVYPLAPFMDKIPEIEEYCYLNNYYDKEIVAYGQKKVDLELLDTQKNFFSFFPFEIIKGNGTNPLPDSNSISLSEKAAQNIFGKEDPVGKEVKYTGRSLVVRSVYRIQGKSSYMPDAVINLIGITRLKGNEDQWGNFNFGLLLKLKNPEQIDIVKKKIENVLIENRSKKFAQQEGISLEEYLKKNGSMKTIYEPLSMARLHSIVEGYPEGRGNYQFLLIIVGLSVLILLLSIVNYVNLATANAIKRAKEVGVRKVLGASKNNIIKQFLFEAVLTAFTAILVALVIVELALPFYNDFLSKDLALNSTQFYQQLILIFITVIVTAGLLPAIYVSNFEMLKVLRGNFSRSKSGIWLRNGMLIVQFAIASFFIVGSYIVYLQVNFMMNKDLGLNGEQVLEIVYHNPKVEPTQNDLKILYSHYEAVRDEIKKIKGVQGVAGGAFTLGADAGSSSGYTYNGKNIQGQNMATDFGFLNMMGMKIVMGREINDTFSSDTINSMMINETAAKMMNEKNPIGKEIDWNDKKLRIVGVVKDFHLTGPQNKIPPMSFFHLKTIDWMSYNLQKMYVKISPEAMPQAIADIEKLWTSKIDTEYPFSYDFVDKTYARTYLGYIKQRNLFSLLNGVVIAIALFGLFALASYSIQRRMKEIAIRKTLGAETIVLMKQLSIQYIVFCIMGFIIAALPAWILLEKWLENFAFRIDVSLMPFIIGFIILMLLTLAVVLGRAFAATRVNVLKYLKYE